MSFLVVFGVFVVIALSVGAFDTDEPTPDYDASADETPPEDTPPGTGDLLYETPPDPPSVSDPPVIDDQPEPPATLNIDGSDGTETIQGSDLAEVLNALGGDDTVEALGGNDTLLGGDGDDFLDGGRGDDLYYGGAGNDSVREDWDAAAETDGSNSGNDTAFGGDGEDYLRGYFGNDSLNGGTGADTIWADQGDDTLIGGEGDDDLRAHEGDDLLDGCAGDDTLTAGPGRDTLLGGAGNDSLDGIDDYGNAAGVVDTKIIDAGAGDDILDFRHDSTVRGGAGADIFRLEDDLSDALVARVEDFDPDEDAFQIRIAAGDGDGGGFALTPRMDGSGYDLFNGVDKVVEILSPKEVALDDLEIAIGLDPTPDGTTVYTLGAGDGSFVYGVSGSPGDDQVIGNENDNWINVDSGRTLGGSDLVDGAGGNDTLIGNGGDWDIVEGPDGMGVSNLVAAPDTLNGGAGDDVLVSTDGNSLNGGSGADQFVLTADNSPGRAGLDIQPSVLIDYAASEDQITLMPSPGRALDTDLVEVRLLVDGSGSEIVYDGASIAHVLNAHGLSVADLTYDNRGYNNPFPSHSNPVA